VHKDQLDLGGLPDQLAQQELRDQQERLVHRALQVQELPELPVLLVLPDQMEQPVLGEFKVKKVFKDQQVLLVRQEYPDLLALQVRQELRELRVVLAHKVLQGQLVYLEQQDYMLLGQM
jgi:hypothetical protein